MFGRLADDRHAFHDLQAVAFQSDDLPGIVGQQPDLAETKVDQDLRTDPVVPEVRLEPQFLVGLHGVHARVLQRVRMDLVLKPDPSPFLPHVEKHPPPLFPDPFQGRRELVAAIAPE